MFADFSFSFNPDTGAGMDSGFAATPTAQATLDPNFTGAAQTFGTILHKGIIQTQAAPSPPAGFTTTLTNTPATLPREAFIAATEAELTSLEARLELPNPLTNLVAWPDKGDARALFKDIRAQLAQLPDASLKPATVALWQHELNTSMRAAAEAVAHFESLYTPDQQAAGATAVVEAAAQVPVPPGLQHTELRAPEADDPGMLAVPLHQRFLRRAQHGGLAVMHDALLVPNDARGARQLAALFNEDYGAGFGVPALPEGASRAFANELRNLNGLTLATTVREAASDVVVAATTAPRFAKVKDPDPHRGTVGDGGLRSPDFPRPEARPRSRAAAEAKPSRTSPDVVMDISARTPKSTEETRDVPVESPKDVSLSLAWLDSGSQRPLTVDLRPYLPSAPTAAATGVNALKEAWRAYAGDTYCRWGAGEQQLPTYVERFRRALDARLAPMPPEQQRVYLLNLTRSDYHRPDSALRTLLDPPIKADVEKASLAATTASDPSRLTGRRNYAITQDNAVPDIRNMAKRPEEPLSSTDPVSLAERAQSPLAGKIRSLRADQRHLVAELYAAGGKVTALSSNRDLNKLPDIADALLGNDSWVDRMPGKRNKAAANAIYLQILGLGLSETQRASYQALQAKLPQNRLKGAGDAYHLGHLSPAGQESLMTLLSDPSSHDALSQLSGRELRIAAEIGASKGKVPPVAERLEMSEAHIARLLPDIADKLVEDRRWRREQSGAGRHTINPAANGIYHRTLAAALTPQQRATYEQVSALLPSTRAERFDDASQLSQLSEQAVVQLRQFAQTPEFQGGISQLSGEELRVLSEIAAEHPPAKTGPPSPIKSIADMVEQDPMYVHRLLPDIVDKLVGDTQWRRGEEGLGGQAVAQILQLKNRLSPRAVDLRALEENLGVNWWSRHGERVQVGISDDGLAKLADLTISPLLSKLRQMNADQVRLVAELVARDGSVWSLDSRKGFNQLVDTATQLVGDDRWRTENPASSETLAAAKAIYNVALGACLTEEQRASYTILARQLEFLGRRARLDDEGQLGRLSPEGTRQLKRVLVEPEYRQALVQLNGEQLRVFAEMLATPDNIKLKIKITAEKIGRSRSYISTSALPDLVDILYGGQQWRPRESDQGSWGRIASEKIAALKLEGEGRQAYDAVSPYLPKDRPASIDDLAQLSRLSNQGQRELINHLRTPELRERLMHFSGKQLLVFAELLAKDGKIFTTANTIGKTRSEVTKIMFDLVDALYQDQQWRHGSPGDAENLVAMGREKLNAIRVDPARRGVYEALSPDLSATRRARIDDVGQLSRLTIKGRETLINHLQTPELSEPLNRLSGEQLRFFAELIAQDGDVSRTAASLGRDRAYVTHALPAIVDLLYGGREWRHEGILNARELGALSAEMISLIKIDPQNRANYEAIKAHLPEARPNQVDDVGQLGKLSLGAKDELITHLQAPEFSRAFTEFSGEQLLIFAESLANDGFLGPTVQSTGKTKRRVKDIMQDVVTKLYGSEQWLTKDSGEYEYAQPTKRARAKISTLRIDPARLNVYDELAPYLPEKRRARIDDIGQLSRLTDGGREALKIHLQTPELSDALSRLSGEQLRLFAELIAEDGNVGKAAGNIGREPNNVSLDLPEIVDLLYQERQWRPRGSFASGPLGALSAKLISLIKVDPQQRVNYEAIEAHLPEARPIYIDDVGQLGKLSPRAREELITHLRAPELSDAFTQLSGEQLLIFAKLLANGGGVTQTASSLKKPVSYVSDALPAITDILYGGQSWRPFIQGDVELEASDALRLTSEASRKILDLPNEIRRRRTYNDIKTYLPGSRPYPAEDYKQLGHLSTEGLRVLKSFLNAPEFSDRLGQLSGEQLWVLAEVGGRQISTGDSAAADLLPGIVDALHGSDQWRFESGDVAELAAWHIVRLKNLIYKSQNRGELR